MVNLLIWFQKHQEVFKNKVNYKTSYSKVQNKYDPVDG
jgi:hypothetical protein